MLASTTMLLIVSGSTGSGKRTQVLLLVAETLALHTNIMVTEPRRSSFSQGLAGFRRRIAPTTHIVYCTTGVLLWLLRSDPLLLNYSHVVVDETTYPCRANARRSAPKS